MPQTPPAPPGDHPPRAPSELPDEFVDFEADPTSISQIPQAPQQPMAPQQSMAPQQPMAPQLPHQAPPRPSQQQMQPPAPIQHTPPQMFAQPSPQLSHVGTPTDPNIYLGTMTSAQIAPGPPMSQVSGVIAAPTPFVTRSRIYAFVVDETGQPIELGSGRFAKAYLGEERLKKCVGARGSGALGAGMAAGAGTSRAVAWVAPQWCERRGMRPPAVLFDCASGWK